MGKNTSLSYHNNDSGRRMPTNGQLEEEAVLWFVVRPYAGKIKKQQQKISQKTVTFRGSSRIHL
jgi:hypothetical protein